MKKSKQAHIPLGLLDKGNQISLMTGLPRTQAFSIFSDSISTPSKIQVIKMPRSKKKFIKLIWEREIPFK